MARSACTCTLWRIVQEWRVGANELRLCLQRTLLLFGRQKTDFLIWGWYGRIGNNVQQLIVAIAHAEAFHGCTSLDKDLLMDGPTLGASPIGEAIHYGEILCSAGDLSSAMPIGL
jgi:hypothetical protein